MKTNQRPWYRYHNLFGATDKMISKKMETDNLEGEASLFQLY
jgi:hypothetical protein